jgi:hypothetical protein
MSPVGDQIFVLVIIEIAYGTPTKGVRGPAVPNAKLRIANVGRCTGRPVTQGIPCN